MKRQYLRLFSFLIGITFIISGILFTLVNNYKEEKKKKVAEEDAIADEIVDISSSDKNRILCYENVTPFNFILSGNINFFEFLLFGEKSFIKLISFV